MKTPLSILSHSDKLNAFAVKKNQVRLDKAKLEREAWLAIINSGSFITTFTLADTHGKEIKDVLCKIFAFVLHFATLFQREILKIF